MNIDRELVEFGRGNNNVLDNILEALKPVFNCLTTICCIMMVSFTFCRLHLVSVHIFKLDLYNTFLNTIF
jgi:hypothetical protein